MLSINNLNYYRHKTEKPKRPFPCSIVATRNVHIILIKKPNSDMVFTLIMVLFNSVLQLYLLRYKVPLRANVGRYPCYFSFCAISRQNELIIHNSKALVWPGLHSNSLRLELRIAVSSIENWSLELWMSLVSLPALNEIKTWSFHPLHSISSHDWSQIWSPFLLLHLVTREAYLHHK